MSQGFVANWKNFRVSVRATVMGRGRWKWNEIISIFSHCFFVISSTVRGFTSVYV